MEKIFHVYLEDYEGEFWFNNKGEFLQGWACNDANWRSEYMNPLLESLGFEVVSIYEPDKFSEIYYKAEELASDWWGPLDNGDEQEDEQEEHY